MQFVLRDQSPVQITIQRADQMKDESRTIHTRLPVTRRLNDHLLIHSYVRHPVPAGTFYPGVQVQGICV